MRHQFHVSKIKSRRSLSRNSFEISRISCELKEIAPLHRAATSANKSPDLLATSPDPPSVFLTRALARRTCDHTCVRTTTGRCCAHTLDPRHSRSALTSHRETCVACSVRLVSTSACSSSSPCVVPTVARRGEPGRGQKTAKGISARRSATPARVTDAHDMQRAYMKDMRKGKVPHFPFGWK